MRHKDVNWNLPPGVPTQDKKKTVHRHEDIQHALMMDLRDELKAMNAALDRVSSTLLRVDRRFAKIAPLTRRAQK